MFINKTLKTLLLIFVLGISLGCQFLPSKGAFTRADDVVNPIEQFSELDLIVLIAGYDAKNTCKVKTEQKVTTSENVQCAINLFYEENKKNNANFKSKNDKEEKSLNDIELKRNRIIERVVSASQVQCDKYIDHLQSAAAQEDFALGSITTLLAGVGGLVTDTTSARALSGAAGITSGIDAQFKESFFSNFAVHVLSPAIRLRRNELLNRIDENKGNTIFEYTLERGLKDAFEYHGSCNMITGLEVASASIQKKKESDETETARVLNEATKLLADLQKERQQIDPRIDALPDAPIDNQIVALKQKTLELQSERNQIKRELENIQTHPNTYRYADIVRNLKSRLNIITEKLYDNLDELDKAAAAR